MITAGEIEKLLYCWAPRALAWEKDNTGLLVGSPDADVGAVLVALDVTLPVIEEASRLGASLLVTHHPLMFHPLRAVKETEGEGRLIAELLRRGISLIAMHTNADAADPGVNTVLAERLGLRNARPLAPIDGWRRRLEIVINRYREHAAGLERILAGASTSGFWSSVGQGKCKLELDTTSWAAAGMLREIRESVGGDMLRVSMLRSEDVSPGYGIGAVGEAESPLEAGAFLRHVKEALDIQVLRCSPHEEGRMIRRIAVCGGAGASYVAAAVAPGADAFISGDLTYHVFQDFRDRILLVDAGHYETERVFLGLCAGALRESLFSYSGKIDIFTYSGSTNAIRTITYKQETL